MDLREALINKYNTPLTFIRVEPIMKDVGDYIDYTINNIEKIVIRNDDLFMNLDGGEVVILRVPNPAIEDGPISNRILDIDIIKDDKTYNSIIDLSSKNVMVILDNGVLTLLLQKINSDILNIINGREELLQNYPLISYDSKMDGSNKLITTFMYQDTPIDIPRVIEYTHSIINTREDNIIASNEINKFYNKCKDNISNLDMIFNKLMPGKDLMLIYNGGLYKLSCGDDGNATISYVIVNNDYSITMKKLDKGYSDIIDMILNYQCNIVELTDYIVYGGVIMNNKFQIVDVTLPEINDYYNMRNYIDEIDKYCEDNDDLSNDLIYLQAKLLETNYKKYNTKKYFKDNTLIISNGRIISTVVFNQIVEKYIEAVKDNMIEDENNDSSKE